MGASNSTQVIKQKDDADSFEIKPLYLLKKELNLELGFDINPEISLLKRKNKRQAETDTQLGHPHLFINDDLYDRVRKPFKEGEIDPPFLSKRTLDPYNKYAHLENTDSDTQGSEQNFMGLKSRKRDKKLDKKDHYKKHNVGYSNYRNQQHFFKTFIEYRFMDSFRQNLTDNNFWGHYRRDLRTQYLYDKQYRLRQMKQHDKIVKVPEVRPPDKAQIISPVKLKLLMKQKTRATPKRSLTLDSAPSLNLPEPDLKVNKQSTKYYNMGHIQTNKQFETNHKFITEKTRENTQKNTQLMPDLGPTGDITSKKLVGIINTGAQQPSKAQQFQRRSYTPVSLSESTSQALSPVNRRKSQSMDQREPVTLSERFDLINKIKQFFNKDSGDDQVRKPGLKLKPQVTTTTKNSKYKRKTDINATLRRRTQSVHNLKKVEEEQAKLEESLKKKSILDGVAVKKGLQKATAGSPKKIDAAVKQNRFERDPEEQEYLYQKDSREKNILVTTWIDDMKLPQQEMQRRNLFFMNESILLKQNLNDHFDKSNVKLFYESGLEFICLKGSSAKIYGKTNHYEPMIDENHRIARIKDLRAFKNQRNDRSMNQDSFFSVVDGNLKMIGVFDGHGDQGHLISSAASAHLLDYLRNRNDTFKTKNLPNATPEQIKHEIKCAFKYTQNVLREDFLISQDRQKLQKQKTISTKKTKNQTPRMINKKRKAVFSESKRVDGIPEDKNSDIEMLSNRYSNTSSQDDEYIQDLQDKYERAAEAINFQEYKKFDGSSEWEQEDKKNFWFQGSDYQSEISFESSQKSEKSGSKGRDSKRSLKQFKLTNDAKNIKYGKRRYRMNLNFKINKRRLLKEVKRELISKACRKGDKDSNTLGSNINSKASASQLVSQDEIIKIPHERLRQSLEKRVLIEKLKKIRRVKRELDIMQNSHRPMQLNERNCFKVINKGAEVRYQVQRESQRLIARNKLMIQDKTKDQFLKFKRMKMLLQQQSRQFSQGHMNTITEKNSIFETPQPRSGRKMSQSYSSSVLNTEQEHEGGSNIDNTSNQNSRNSYRTADRAKEQRIRQSVAETLRRMEENKNEINPFSVNVDVRDEEFQSNQHSNVDSRGASKHDNISDLEKQEDELSDQNSEDDASSSSNQNTEIHISDEDDEDEQVQLERLQQGEVNFGLKDQSDDSLQAEIEEQLLFEEDIIQKYKLLGSDSDPLDDDFEPSSESESDESSSSPSKSECSQSDSQDSSDISSQSSSQSNSGMSKSKQTSSSLMKNSKNKTSKRSSQSCSETFKSIDSFAQNQQKIKLIQNITSQSKVYEQKQQKSKSLQAEAKLSRVKTTLELQYDKMELNKFKRTRQDQLQKVSKKKFSFKNEDKREQIKRIKEREFHKRVTGREKQEFNLDIAMSGTTATLVIIYDGIIYYGWVGDSLACLSKPMNACSQKNIQNNELILTLPFHTPMDQNEKMRIYRNKGEIRNEKPKEKKTDEKDNEKEELNKLSQKMKGNKNDKDENGTKIEQLRKIEKQKKDFTTGQFDPFTCPRIYNRGRLYPGLQVSRSLGDFLGHRIGVTSEPGVGSYKFTKHNEYLVVASRSLWNEMSPKEVFEFISMHSHYEQMGTVPCLLADKVRDSCMQEAMTPIQDMTIVIHSLNANIAKFK